MTLRYIIRTDIPFNGVIYDVIEGEEYTKPTDFPVRAINEQEFENLILEFCHSLITTPIEESFSDYEEVLNILPPCRWGKFNAFEVFHISEPFYGNIVDWHVWNTITNKCYTFKDFSNTKISDILQSVITTENYD